MPFYRKIIHRAFRISWKNPWLWLFGFFAAFIGNGSVYEALFRGLNNLSEGRSVFDTLREYADSGVLSLISWAKFTTLWHGDLSGLILSVLFLLLFICIVALLIGLGVICQAGVIHSVVAIDEKKKVSFKHSFKAGLEHFWPVLELNVFTKVILLGIVFLLVYIVWQLAPHNVAMYTIATIIFVLLGIVIYFLTVYGTAFIVLRRRSAFVALKYAWHLFRHNVVLNLEMGLLLFIFNVLLIIGFFAAGFILMSPFFLLYMIFALAGIKLGATILAGILVIVAIIFIFFVGAWWSTFQLGAWALLFEELVLKGGKSKLRRAWEYLKGK